MKILGISTYSVEQLEDICGSENSSQIMTFLEFYNRKEDLDQVIIVDQISKLNLILGINILDMKLYQDKWIRKDVNITKDYIMSCFKDTKDIQDVEFQHKYIPDFNLKDFSFLAHITEYQINQYEFFEKVHNILTKTKKESFNCSDKYKSLLKEKLLNKEISDLYQDFLNKEKKDYPELFRFIATVRRRQYSLEEIETES